MSDAENPRVRRRLEQLSAGAQYRTDVLGESELAKLLAIIKRACPDDMEPDGDALRANIRAYRALEEATKDEVGLHLTAKELSTFAEQCERVGKSVSTLVEHAALNEGRLTLAEGACDMPTIERMAEEDARIDAWRAMLQFLTDDRTFEQLAKAARSAADSVAAATPKNAPRKVAPLYTIRDLASIFEHHAGRLPPRAFSPERGDHGPFYDFVAVALRLVGVHARPDGLIRQVMDARR
jgi:hypothetical protein